MPGAPLSLPERESLFCLDVECSLQGPGYGQRAESPLRELDFDSTRVSVVTHVLRVLNARCGPRRRAGCDQSRNDGSVAHHI